MERNTTTQSGSTKTASNKKAKPGVVMTGAEILVQSLVDHGVEVIFAYPGGCSMPLHQALTKAGDKIRTILPRHEQGGTSPLRVTPAAPVGSA